MRINDTIGFALVSSTRNRILFYDQDYKATKLAQLHFLRNDVLYLVPVNKFMLNKIKGQKLDVDFNKDTCTQFTFTNANTLHVELDIAPWRLSKMFIEYASTPNDDVQNINQNLTCASKLATRLEQLVAERLQFCHSESQYIVTGYQMFDSFCKDVLGDDNLSSIIQTDISDETQYIEQIKEIKKCASKSLMALDYTDSSAIKHFKHALEIYLAEYNNPHSQFILKGLYNECV